MQRNDYKLINENNEITGKQTFCYFLFAKKIFCAMIKQRKIKRGVKIVKDKKQDETITDEELVELFNQTSSTQEKLQYFLKN